MLFTYIVIEIVANLYNGWHPTRGPKSTSTVARGLHTPEEVIDLLCDGDHHWGHYGFHVGQGVRIKTYVFQGKEQDMNLFWNRLDEALLTTDFEV
jgi:hypothetical protein